MSFLLLDTCALLFITMNEPEAGKVKSAMLQAYEAGEFVYVSPISAWEIGLLVSTGRLNLSMPPNRWFDNVMRKPGIALVNLSPDVLIAASFLPEMPVRDPADRILVATAREYDFTLVTRDRKLLAYAGRGHIQALDC
ncbi:MAG TPA: type II toxin-antitoxin system VapC family toxin [Bradyrhizobium sp.]|jgi:PIN domain nuclease of toxin-antitoxin system|nr:type II toxin-antitoxin system VapC family toxin [Bradyrhizobium sp.]